MVVLWKFDQSHLSVFSPMKFKTCFMKYFFASYFNDATCSKILPPVNRQQTDYSLFKQQQLDTFLGNCLDFRLFFLLIWGEIAPNQIQFLHIWELLFDWDLLFGPSETLVLFEDHHITLLVLILFWSGCSKEGFEVQDLPPDNYSVIGFCCFP